MNTATQREATNCAKDARIARCSPPNLTEIAVLAENQRLAELRRLTIKEVCVLVGRKESSLREMIAAGRFPSADYKDGKRCVRWSAGLVRQWLESTRTSA